MQELKSLMALHNVRNVAVFLAIGCFIGYSVTNSDPLISILLTFGIPIIFVCLIRPRVAVILFCLLSVLTRWKWHLLGGHLRADQLFLPVLLLSLSLAVFGETTRERKLTPFKFFPLFYLLLPLIWVGLNFIASWLNSPAPVLSYRIVLWLSLDVVVFFTMNVVMRRGIVGSREITKALVVLGSLEGMYSVAALLLHVFAHWNLAVQPMNGYWAPFGTFYEANLFGSFEAVVLPFALDARSDSKRWQVLWIVAGLVSSVTRGAWIAGAIVLVAVGIDRARKSSRFGSLFTAVMVFSMLSISAVAFVVPQLVLSHGGTLQARLSALSTIVQTVKHSPWIGMGTNSYGQRTPNGYIGVWFIETFYDTGLLGFVSLMIFLGGLFWGAVRIRRMDLVLSMVAMTISYQATSGIWFSYSWIVLAVVYHGVFDGREISGVRTLPTGGFLQ